MKKILICILFFCLSALAMDAQEVSLRINGGISDSRLKVSAEGNVSALLSAINRASEKNSEVDMEGVWISRDGADELNRLWSNGHFHCMDELVVEKAIATYDGNLQVRNIPIEMNEGEGNRYQEASVDFDRDGRIVNIRFALNADLYRKLMMSEAQSDELRRRQLILSYVEQFRTAYNLKDIDFLEQVFSDDALIITGKVVKTKASDLRMLPSDKISYNVYSKTQYLTRLRSVFASASYIDVKFSDVQISRHPTKPDYYGVMVKQGYKSNVYEDEGYVFLLWDFSDEYAPQIHVRTWQPYWLDEEQTVRLSEKDIIGIHNFNL